MLSQIFGFRETANDWAIELKAELQCSDDEVFARLEQNIKDIVGTLTIERRAHVRSHAEELLSLLRTYQETYKKISAAIRTINRLRSEVQRARMDLSPAFDSVFKELRKKEEKKIADKLAQAEEVENEFSQLVASQTKISEEVINKEREFYQATYEAGAISRLNEGELQKQEETNSCQAFRF